jgi:hypothetical protein
MASPGFGFGDDCWRRGEVVVVGGDEVAVDVARFAGLYISRLTSSASASAILSSVVFYFFGVFFATTGLMVVPLLLPRLDCLGSYSTFVWLAVRLMKLVLDSDGPSAFASSSGVSV